MVTTLTPNVDSGSLGGDRRSSNHDSRDTDEVGNVCCVQIADGDVGCGGVEEELVRGKRDVSLGGIDDSLRALLQSGFELP